MVIIGILGILIANIGFWPAIEHGALFAFWQATPGILVAGYAFYRLFKDIERCEREEKVAKRNPADIAASILFGLGMAMGFLPIALASLIVKQNLFTECFDRMDGFWRSRGWK